MPARPDRPPLRDYSRSRAVLMGTWNYTYLTPVPPVANSLRRMTGLLSSSLCGWPADRILQLKNEPGPGDIPDRLITAFDDVDDVALFYFAGHGQIAPDDQLCLGLVLSRPEANRRAATSLRFADVRQAMADSPAATKVVILDCCFAGLATLGALSGPTREVLDLTSGTGAYTMAATSAYATAWYEEEPGLSRPQTFFTKYLADLVERGIPGQPSLLRLDPLFKQLRDNLTADHRPVPGSRAVNDAREFVFAYNAAPPESQRDPEREVAQLSRRLAETTAQIETLTALAAEREAELAEMRSELVSMPAASARRRDELEEKIDEVASKVEELSRREREANRQSEEAARQLDQARAVAQPAPESPSALPSPGPVVTVDSRRRVRKGLLVRGAIMTVLLGGLIAGLVVVLPGGAHSSATEPPVKPSATAKPTLSVSGAWTSDRFPQAPVAVAYGPGGTTLAVGTLDIRGRGLSMGSAYLVRPGTTARPVQYDAKGDVTAVAFGPGGTLATLDADGDLYWWSTVTGKPVGTFLEQYAHVFAISAAPDGLLAVADITDTVYLWNIRQSKITASFSIPSSKALDWLAIAPDGDHAVVADVDGRVYLCNTGTKSPILMRPGLPGGATVLSLAFAPDNTTVAVGASKGTTYLWDTVRNTSTTVTDPSSTGVDSAAFSPNGAILATGDANGMVYFWDVRTGGLITQYPFFPPGQNVNSVAFSPDGKDLAVADSDGYVYEWRITIG
jgi:TolA-binding protein